MGASDVSSDGYSESDTDGAGSTEVTPDGVPDVCTDDEGSTESVSDTDGEGSTDAASDGRSDAEAGSKDGDALQAEAQSPGGQSPESRGGQSSESSADSSDVESPRESIRTNSVASDSEASEHSPPSLGDSSSGSVAGGGAHPRDSIWKSLASQEWVGHLPDMSVFRTRCPPRLLFPCAGFDGAGQSLRAMGVDYEMAGAWETSRAPSQVLRKMYGANSSKLHLNRDDGDVMKVRLVDLPLADGVVSGPPCPPWSSMGPRSRWKDQRARVLKRIIQWIVHLSSKGLKFFVLENVRGFAHAPRGKRHSPLNQVLRMLQRRLRGSWKVEVVHTNSFCTAHSRPRVYIVGYRIHASIGADTGIADTIVVLPRASLGQILVNSLPNTEPASLVTTHRRKLKKWLRKLRPWLTKQRTSNSYACFNVDRDPAKTRALFRVDGAAPCLRAGAGRPWVQSLGRSLPMVSRFLHPAEACMLQGMSPAIIPEGMSDAAVFYGCGNAMTVPVVGSILSALLRRVQPFLKRKRGCCDGEP